ncbi:MAG TPA: protein translocase subunit SecF, partial [Firmicutes bacterium]|nr:protein translocase subunit SecF [Bacillota bacterium]
MKKFSIKFYQHRKIYIGISLAIFAVGIICNLIFGTELDIDFRGGALVEYSYTGTVDQETVDQAIADALGQPVTVTITDGLTDAAGNSTNTLTISLSGSDGISLDDQQAIDDQLAAAYPDSTFEMIQSSSVPPTMGSMFFAKCLVAVGLAAVLLVVYVAFRFRKIGGMSAGVMSLVALFHDVLMVYF